MRTAGVMDVAVVQAQIHQMGHANQHAAQGHHHGMRHRGVVQRAVQKARPQRGQARDQEAQRAQRAMPAPAPDQAEQAQQGDEAHQRQLHAVTHPDRQAQ
ncbi:hypothetical protein D3C71_1506080 [compost metagenome]